MEQRLIAAPQNPGGAWSARKPSFWRSFWALIKKTWHIKTRHFAAFMEFLGAILIFNLIWPVHKYARIVYQGSADPDINHVEQYNVTELSGFGNLDIVIQPDNNATHELCDQIIDLIRSANITVNSQYVNSTEELRDFIYLRDMNGLGIYWVNSDDEDCWTNPEIQVFHQMLLQTPDTPMFRIIKMLITQHNKAPSLMLARQSLQMFATPTRTNIFDIRLLVGFFSLMPVMFATMDDFQIILDEKDNKIAALTFLMGCPESAYWLVQFIVPFVTSIIPHLVMAVMYCNVYMMLGTSISVFMALSLLFIAAHVLFQMFLSTFMKHSRNGRATMVTTCVFIYFFSFLHMYVTLDPNNTGDWLKHLVSVIPFSAYQLPLMTMYTQCRESLPPITWSTLSVNEAYDCRWAFFWLTADIFIYLLLFVIFNATNSREFGTPAIAWRNILKIEAWKHAFRKRGVSVRQMANIESMVSLDDDGDRGVAIEVSNLSKTYHAFKEVHALADVNFKIAAGEVIVVIGPNGAGKSTLMNTLSGTIMPSSGTLRLFGGPETIHFRDIQEILGICFQENVILEKLSVREHFELFGAFRGVSREELDASIEFFSDTLQLTHMLDNRAGDLSGGQKRKLCIGITLLGNPPIVIMDEPTAGVDVQARQLIWKTISALKHVTTIVTSHALEEAEAVSSRLFIVAGGHLVFQGTSTELRRQYKCGYLLKVDGANESVMQRILEIAKKYVPDSHRCEDRPDAIGMSVADGVPQFLAELKEKKQELGIVSYSFSVEQLEDMLMKLIQSGESQIEVNH